MKAIARDWRFRVVALILMIALLLYTVWQQATKIRGDQIVNFTPALADCGSEGRLHYCRYRARAGSNGDT